MGAIWHAGKGNGIDKKAEELGEEESVVPIHHLEAFNEYKPRPTALFALCRA